MNKRKRSIIDWWSSIVALMILIVPVAAWVTHVIASIKAASWVLLIVGSLIFPIGIIHGIAIWFGAL